MADVYNLLEQISSAIYGEDVRGSIHDAIEQCYEDATGNPASLSNLISSLHDLGDIVEMEPVQITSLEVDTEYFLGSNTIYLSPGAWIIEYGLAVGPHDSQSLSEGDSGEIFVANTSTSWSNVDAERIFTYRYGVPNEFRHFVFVDENNPIWEEIITGDDPNAGKAPVHLHLYNDDDGFALDARVFIKAICLKKQGSDEPGGSIEEQVAQNTADIADVKSDLNDLDDRVEALEEGGGGGSGLTADLKAALDQLAQKVAYIDEDGQTYYDALHAALYPPANLTRISCVYTQSGTVYDTDSLDSLKSDLVVTAHFSDGTTQTVTTYTLSGTLTEGTSTITVSYGGKTTAFTVTVTHEQTYVTDGLIHQWDAIENTRNGHSSSTAVWEDLVGTNDLTVNNITGIAWETDAVNFQGTNGIRFLGNELATTAENKTVEVVFSQDTARSECICSVFHNSDAVNPAYGKVVLFSDGTFNVRGESSKAYITGLNSITDFHHIGASYSSINTINKAYANGVEAVQGSATHSLQTSSSYPSVGASPTNYDYAFNGKVHCIRIYNKILTDAEVAQNYAIDVARFNLGA